jgi:hypothetical protein
LEIVEAEQVVAEADASQPASQDETQTAPTELINSPTQVESAAAP